MAWSLLVFLFPLYLSCATGNDMINETRVTAKLTEELAKQNYDPAIRPLAGGPPVVVKISMHVISLRGISEQSMSYQLEMYFSERWCDERLTYDPREFNGRKSIYIHDTMADSIWHPGTFFPNTIESKYPEPKSVTHREMLRLTPDGCLLRTRRLSVTAECPMDLKLYPFDMQMCKLSIESFSSTVEHIQYVWNETAVELGSTLELPMFKVKEVKTKFGIVGTEIGDFSRLACCFVLHRNAGMFYFQVFLPSAGIVLMAWLVLWVKGAHQFSDLLAVLLATAFQYFMYHSMQPNISYLKALDVYMAVYLGFIFGAVVKSCILTLINDIRETNGDYTLVASNSHDNSQPKTHKQSLEHLRKFTNIFTNRCCNIINVLYVVLWLTFCIVYFAVLLSINPVDVQKHSTCEVE